MSLNRTDLQCVFFVTDEALGGCGHGYDRDRVADFGPRRQPRIWVVAAVLWPIACEASLHDADQEVDDSCRFRRLQDIASLITGSVLHLEGSAVRRTSSVNLGVR